MKLLAQTCLAAFLTSLLLTPWVRALAKRWSIVDHPDEHRKLHIESTPLGGGVVVLIASTVAIVAALVFSDSQRAGAAENALFLTGLLASAVVLCGVGLVDDRFGLRGRQKLLGQIVAAAIVMATGLYMERVEILGHTIELGITSAPMTLFWILGAINAVNLLDGLDGLATSVGIVLSAAVAAMASLTGHQTEAFLALALAGALAGFLVYNRPPASIFLGDAGSMLIGLVLGALAIRSSLKGPTSVVLAGPIAIWAIPIFDVAMAILRRKLTGRSIYTTDRGHLHHTLQHLGYSDRKVGFVVGTCCCLTAIGATLSVYQQTELIAYGAIAVVCAMLVLTRIFGHHEFILLLKQVKRLCNSIVPTFSPAETRPNQTIQTRLRGNRQWEDLWGTLTVFAERFELTTVQLNVNLPAIGEEYHASWHRKGQLNELDCWQSDIPLLANNVTVGRLRIAGVSHGGHVCSWMGELIAGLEPFETHMLDLLDNDNDEVDLDAHQGALSQLVRQEGLAPHATKGGSALGLLDRPDDDEASK